MYKLLLICFLILSGEMLTAQPSHVYQAKATFYAKKFNGRRTFSGEKFSNKKYTAAHRSFPLQSLVKVTNPRNNKSVIVRINDRFHRKNMIDLTYIAAKKIEIIGQGTAKVKLQLLDNSCLQQYLNQAADSTFIEPIADSLSPEEFVDTTQHYYIRLASCKLEKNAEQEVNKRLLKEYRNLASIKKLHHRGKAIYKIILGPFNEKEEAAQLLKKLKTKFKDAKLVHN
ncbi:MAG: septal ring lytic transglycosylase RlpA family protein [Bacteroidetes bacterium]|nr:septal ring lytic transglycosylase RlpA family protein [Bacteroidota bacterium]